MFASKEHAEAQIAAEAAQNCVNVLIANLADAKMKIQALEKELADLKAKPAEGS